eukprot:9472119-Pyramimonas_sp.AAC.1
MLFEVTKALSFATTVDSSCDSVECLMSSTITAISFIIIFFEGGVPCRKSAPWSTGPVSCAAIGWGYSCAWRCTFSSSSLNFTFRFFFGGSAMTPSEPRFAAASAKSISTESRQTLEAAPLWGLSSGSSSESTATEASSTDGVAPPAASSAISAVATSFSGLNGFCDHDVDRGHLAGSSDQSSGILSGKVCVHGICSSSSWSVAWSVGGMPSSTDCAGTGVSSTSITQGSAAISTPSVVRRGSWRTYAFD